MKLTTLQRAALGAALTASLITAGVAQTTVAPASTAAPAAAATMSMQQVLERITTLGYRDVREIERKSDKLFEVEARNDKGQAVELYVDARSGEILKQEIKTKGSRP